MNHNEITQMNNDDALELGNQMQREKSSEQNYGEVLEISEQDLKRKKEFLSWIAEEAGTHEDYIEFYKSAENKWLDKMIEKQYLGNNGTIQLHIRKGALKLAKKDDFDFAEAAQKIYDVLIQLRENDAVHYSHHHDHTSTNAQIQEKNQRKNELNEFFTGEILKVLNEYYQKSGSGNAADQIISFQNELMNMSHGGGELVEKIREANNISGLALENAINYPFDSALRNAQDKFDRERRMDKYRDKK